MKFVKKEILVVLLPLYADWEAAFVMATLNDQIQNNPSPYQVKTVGLTKEPVQSLGGLAVLPDYSLGDAPQDFEALMLIGGMSWCTENRAPTTLSQQVIPLAKSAVDKGRVLGAICDATTFLGANGWLNDRKHTSNTLEDLMQVSGIHYTGKAQYIKEQAVRDGQLVTANGTAYLEFTREVLLSLKAYKPQDIETHYNFYKLGYYEAVKKDFIPKGI